MKKQRQRPAKQGKEKVFYARDPPRRGKGKEKVFPKKGET